MTVPTDRRRLLPLFGPHGSRSAATCHFRCGNACFHPEPNTSGNEHIQTILEGVIARRSVLKAGAVGAAAAGLGALQVVPAAAKGSEHSSGGGFGFTPVPPNNLDNITIPAGYEQALVIAWGDPVVAGAPAFDPAAQTPEAQAMQFGYNCDYVSVLPLKHVRGKERALLVVNHEYTDEPLMFPTGAYDLVAQAHVAMAAHGLSIVEIERDRHRGQWLPVPGADRFNRRITANTPMEITGPAAGDGRLAGDVLGTLNNCSGGTTPWGTVLSGEENFNQYFDASVAVASEHATSFTRYGIRTTAGLESRRWSDADPRFDLGTNPTEAYKFGWIVEIDPYDPDSTPKKRSMLGRFKHEAATVTIARDGRVVAYSGDDERGDYLYKFVSRDRYRGWDRRHNMSLLDHGTLYVAKFSGALPQDLPFDGSGEWIPLTSDTESFVPDFSVAEVLINTRLAADTVAATRMDRPEDVERNPVNGNVYMALTNNSNRGNPTSNTPLPDAANPITMSHTRPSLGAPLVQQSGNRNGYVLELAERRNDAAATTFSWNLFLVCGDPEAEESYFAGFPKDQVSPISAPDNVTFDPAGNLWISTDGNVLGSNDGLFAVPVAGRDRGKVQQFLTMPLFAETCGPFVTEDGRTVFVAVQHPGETAPLPPFEAPRSLWPHTHAFPRPGVANVWHGRGRRIGA